MNNLEQKVTELNEVIEQAMSELMAAGGTGWIANASNNEVLAFRTLLKALSKAEAIMAEEAKIIGEIPKLYENIDSKLNITASDLIKFDATHKTNFNRIDERK